MNNVLVITMIEGINVFEFNRMFNKSQHIFSVSNQKSFFDVHVFDDILLVYEVQHYCKGTTSTNDERCDLSEILDIVQFRLKKNAILLRMKRDEGMCESIYHYIFLLK